MAEIEFHQGESGESRAAAEGDDIVVALEETPTSGYRWEVERADQAVLSAIDDEFTPPEPGLIGGAGTRRFRFRVTGSGSGAIHLVRRRPWDPDAIADTFEATVEASSGAVSEPDSPAATDTDPFDPPIE
jgi:inhibitor of cysteine peptidase